MATEQLLQDSAQATQLAYTDNGLPAGYARIGDPISDPASGAYAIIGKNTEGQVIVALRGSEDLRDFNADLQLGVTQYRALLDGGLRDALGGLGTDSSVTAVEFVGHSLGGALAQYAAYDYVDSGAGTQEVGLFTYNGLGGVDGIKQMNNGEYDQTVVAQIDAYNLWSHGRDNFADLVSRLSEHVGGNTRLHIVPGDDPVEIHSVQNLQFYSTYSALPMVNVDYLNIPEGLSTAFDVSRIMNYQNVDAQWVAAAITVYDTLFFSPYSEVKEIWQAATNGDFAGLLSRLDGGVADPAMRLTGLLLTAVNAVKGDLDAMGAMAKLVTLGKLESDLKYLASISSELSSEVKDLLVNLGITYVNQIKKISDLFDEAEQIIPWQVIVDPLILDLDGDGVETVNITEGVYFDHRGDGLTERSGWVASDDGLLVWDRNSDGLINDGSELFGDSTRLRDGSLATDGFQALAEYDDNSDGKIDSSDAIWNNLRVWQDTIRDGNATVGELHTLAELNIRSISTTTASPGTQDAAGNIQTLIGGFERTDGSVGQIADYNLLADNTDTVAETRVEITSEIAALPDARGYGRTYDLRQAMARDMSGTLVTLVQNYVAETDPAARDVILEEILFKWAGVEGIDPASRGEDIDARKLGALESFIGEDYVGYSGAIPVAEVVPTLEQAYAGLFELVNAQLLAQTHAKPLYDQINFIWNETTNSFEMDIAPMVAEVQTQFAADPVAGEIMLGQFGRLVRGFDLETALDYGRFRFAIAELGENVLWALDASGKNTIAGSAGSDNVIGTIGSDAFNGGDGNDVLSPVDDGPGYVAPDFQGDDTLYGGAGDDILDSGDGKDVLVGGTGNDTLRSLGGDDIFDGGTGDDYLQGDLGSDTYVFGNGYGIDTVRDGGDRGIETENNNDIVLMTPGTTPDQVSLSFGNAGQDLIFSLNGGADQLTISVYSIRETRFADGTVWDLSTMAAMARAATEGADTIYGMSGADVIHGWGGDDTIEGKGGGDTLFGDAGNDVLYGYGPANYLSGGDGNDYLFNNYFNSTVGGYSILDGGAGDDILSADGSENTFVFGRGYGHDTISGGSGTASNTILMAEDILPSDITVSRDSGAFHFSIIGTVDRLTVNVPANSDIPIPIQFSNGVVWNATNVHQLALQSAGEGADYLSGNSSNDVISGLGGDDVIFGRTGDDTLDGGAGNDIIYGNEGVDYLNGGTGNDSLYGDAGSDVYSFGRGSGQDSIFDANYPYVTGNVAGDIETIQMQAGVAPVDVTFSRGGYQSADLIINISGATDTLSVGRWFDQQDNNTLRITFTDGTIWDAAAINSRLPAQVGTSGVDYLYGDTGANVLSGAGGNDVLNGNAGDDTLDGGAGNDSLRGGNGSDTYLFGNGFGQDTAVDDGLSGIDTVQFASDVTTANVTWVDTSSSSYLSLNGGVDRFIFRDSSGVRVERAVFNDGTVWDLTRKTTIPITGTAAGETLNGTNFIDEIRGLGGNDTLNGKDGDDVLIGGDGNDILVGESGNDTLDGGTGNDSLYGDIGNNTFIFGRGYGLDNVYGDGVIQFNADVLPSDVVLTSNGPSNLVMNIAGTADRLTISSWFDQKRITQFRFADGTQWSIADIDSRVIRTGTTGADTLIAANTGSVLDGGDGNDSLYGKNGNDTLTGGAGNDSIYGGYGNSNDVLEGGSGNDLLAGEGGDDTYIFHRGFGSDTINERLSGTYGGANNKIVFADDILPSEVVVTSDGQYDVSGNNNLYLSIRGTTDIITVSGWMIPGEPTIDRVEFADGTVWDTTVLLSKLALATQEDDVFYGSVGDDIFNSLDGDDEIYGYGGNDELSGSHGDDILYGNEGNDLLEGGQGNDQLFGSAGDDTYVFGKGGGQDVIYDSVATAGNIDTVKMGPGVLPAEVHLFRGQINPADLIITIDGVSDTLTIKNWFANDAFKIERMEFIDGTVWDEATLDSLANQNHAPVVSIPISDQAIAEGTLFSFQISVNTFTDVDEGDILTFSVTLEDGSPLPAWLSFDANTYTLTGSAPPGSEGALAIRVNATDTGNAVASDVFTLTVVGNLILTGTAVADTLTGNIGHDQLYGLGGNDILNGGAGNDTLDGGAGADSLIGGVGNDTYVVDNTGDAITENNNEGSDLVQSSVTYTLANNVEQLTLTGASAINGTGNTMDNVLTGNSAINTLTGGDGYDILDGGAGADILVGGAGDDTYVRDNSSDTVTENANGGTDLVQSSVTYTLVNNVENLTLTGMSAINGTGNTLNNILTGNSAANTLSGGTGVDIMFGGLGDDTYVVDDTREAAIENASEGTDLVQSSISFILGDNVENLTLTGSSAINGTGNALNNTLTGNSAVNTLTGGDGNDTLNGGSGADILVGGAGDDIYVRDNSSDTVTESTNEGTDLVQSSVTYTLANNVENLTLTGTSAINGTGNTLNNVLTGNSAVNTLTGGDGNDTLNGGSGADIMVGGNGDDIYVRDNGSDTVTESASAGTDTVQSSVTYTLANNVENLTLTGTSAINGTGNTLNNVLTGNSAANTLSGGTGIDTMSGGLGNDTYVVDNIGDTVTENTNEGTDLVQSSVTYTLANNVENITLTGSSAINATGNALNNTLTGNSGVNTLTGGDGNDTLNGGSGADILVGGAGDDIYVRDNSSDTVTENANEGTDTVQSSVTYTLANNVENLTLTGTSAISGTGNTLDNVLTGNSAVNTLTGGAGNDTLNGGSGADIMAGGAGDDIYVRDNSSDTVTENANEGIDTVQSSVTYTLANNVENLALTGTSAINGTGNALNNVLTGNSAANTLTGGDGNDTLNGGTGADTMVGGVGDDIYVRDNSSDTVTESTGAGIDTVQSSVTYTLANNVENLTLTGASAINGTGNTLNNVLTGNSAANTLTGGTGNDTYIFGRGFGIDTAVENDATAGNTDLASFSSGIATDQIWFQRTGNNLDVSIIGTTDHLMLQNWYLGNQYHVEQLRTSDGKLLLDSQVENLVSAMAAFSPPPVGQLDLTPELHAQLDGVIAANWQSAA